MKLLELIGSYTGIIGALIIALNAGIVFWGYVFFFVSSITLLILFQYKKLPHAATQQFVFTIINTIGLISWW